MLCFECVFSGIFISIFYVLLEIEVSEEEEGNGKTHCKFNEAHNKLPGPFLQMFCKIYAIDVERQNSDGISSKSRFVSKFLMLQRLFYDLNLTTKRHALQHKM